MKLDGTRERRKRAVLWMEFSVNVMLECEILHPTLAPAPIYETASIAVAQLLQLSSINSIMYKSLNVSNGIFEKRKLFFRLRCHVNNVNSHWRGKKVSAEFEWSGQKASWVCWFSDFFSLIIFGAHEAKTTQKARQFTFVYRRQVTPCNVDVCAYTWRIAHVSTMSANKHPKPFHH